MRSIAFHCLSVNVLVNRCWSSVVQGTDFGVRWTWVKSQPGYLPWTCCSVCLSLHICKLGKYECLSHAVAGSSKWDNACQRPAEYLALECPYWVVFAFILDFAFAQPVYACLDLGNLVSLRLYLKIWLKKNHHVSNYIPIIKDSTL